MRDIYTEAANFAFNLVAKQQRHSNRTSDLFPNVSGWGVLPQESKDKLVAKVRAYDELRRRGGGSLSNDPDQQLFTLTACEYLAFHRPPDTGKEDNSAKTMNGSTKETCDPLLMPNVRDGGEHRNYAPWNPGAGYIVEELGRVRAESAQGTESHFNREFDRLVRGAFSASTPSPEVRRALSTPGAHVIVVNDAGVAERAHRVGLTPEEMYQVGVPGTYLLGPNARGEIMQDGKFVGKVVEVYPEWGWSTLFKQAASNRF